MDGWIIKLVIQVIQDDLFFFPCKIRSSFAASKEHKAWHVWDLRDVLERTKQFKARVLGSFTTWRKTSVTTLLWSWSLSLCMNSLPSMAPNGAPGLLFFVCFSPWLDYPHCVRLLNELEDLFVFLGLAFMLCSGSHWKVSTANPGKTNCFVGSWPPIQYFLLQTRAERLLVFHFTEIAI